MAIDLLGQQHEEHLRARSRGAFLSDLADGRVEEADARRRAEALGFPGSGRGALLPVAASWRGPRSRRGRRAVVDAIVGRAARRAVARRASAVLLGPRDVDLLVLLALGGRVYDEALAEHIAGLFHGVLERRGAGVEVAALAIGAPADTWAAVGQGLRRVRRSAGAATALAPRRWYDARRPGVTDLLHDLRDAPELDAFVDEQLGPLLAGGLGPPARAAGDLEAYLAAGGRKAQAARALHFERQSCTCACAGSRSCSACRWTTRTRCWGCTWRCALWRSAAAARPRSERQPRLEGSGCAGASVGFVALVRPRRFV